MLRGLRRDAEALGALEDDLRRELYLHVRGAGRPVTREEAAAATGISRKLAAFHLDKLVDRGLLTVTYARPPGRGGRGGGRPAKHYEPSDREFDVSIPERRYDLLGGVLLRALRSKDEGKPDEAARRAARDTGLEIGQSERRRRRIARPGPERAIKVTTDVLEDRGYEPYRDERGCVRLRNCPFHALAEQDRDLVCRMNEQLVEGVVRGLGNNTVRVVFDPEPGRCCVRVEPPGLADEPELAESVEQPSDSGLPRVE
jgi:predicted ArsR family transcriptional regulator